MTRKTKPRTNRIIQRVVRLTVEEDLAIKDKATGAGYPSNAKFLRECALGKKMKSAAKIDPTFQKQIWRQVSGIGRNINQIAFKFNSDTWVAPEEFKSILEEIKGLREDLAALGLDDQK